MLRRSARVGLGMEIVVVVVLEDDVEDEGWVVEEGVAAVADVVG
jgi:hypothetical protein